MIDLIACSTCRVSMIEGGGDAAGWSIFFLLTVVLAMLSGISFLMFRLIKRDRESLDPSLCDEFVRADSSH